MHSYPSIQLGVPVCNALLAFGQEKYDEVCVTVTEINSVYSLLISEHSVLSHIFLNSIW